MREEAEGNADLSHTVLTARQLPRLPCGLIETASLTGIAAFSDGTGERMVSLNGREIARLLRRFFQGLREGKLRRTDVLDFLRDRATWHKTSRDDRSLALLVKTP